jgi:hypothetical protein
MSSIADVFNKDNFSRAVLTVSFLLLCGVALAFWRPDEAKGLIKAATCKLLDYKCPPNSTSIVGTGTFEIDGKEKITLKEPNPVDPPKPSLKSGTDKSSSQPPAEQRKAQEPKAPEPNISGNQNNAQSNNSNNQNSNNSNSNNNNTTIYNPPPTATSPSGITPPITEDGLKRPSNPSINSIGTFKGVTIAHNHALRPASDSDGLARLFAELIARLLFKAIGLEKLLGPDGAKSAIVKVAVLKDGAVQAVIPIDVTKSLRAKLEKGQTELSLKIAIPLEIRFDEKNHHYALRIEEDSFPVEIGDAAIVPGKFSTGSLKNLPPRPTGWTLVGLGPGESIARIIGVAPVPSVAWLFLAALPIFGWILFRRPTTLNQTT